MSQEQQLVLLRQYLDAEQSVSCRWLANALDVTIDASKELLQLYKGKNQDIFASYYISGKKSDVAAAGHVALAIEVVPEDRLDECKKKYTTLSSVYIYSLQRTASTDKVLYQQLNTTDLMQAKSYIMMSPKNVSFLLNKSTGGIILKSADISELGQRQLLASTVTATKAPQVSENADEKMARMFANRTIPKGKSVADSASFFGNNKSTTKSSSTASSTAASSKKEDDNKRKVNNMFANNPVKKEVVSAVPSAPESSKNNDEDDEWDDGVGYKPDKNKLKKSRKESDEMNSLVPELAEKNSDDIADLAVETTTENTDSSPQNPASKKAKTFVHGAMDDYMEDVAVAMEIAKENNPQQVAGVKKMKKKLVEKLYSTEDGYLETRYEYEEVTDDEVQVEKKPSPKKAAAKKDEKKASAGQQKGMMSFFSKK